MEWKEVLEDSSLRDLPYKIETNEWGKIVMTPASGTHAIYQALILRWLALSGVGLAVAECPIQTSKGVRVADVAWASAAFLKKHGARILLFPESPEIVIEVQSPSNSTSEMAEKRGLYFESGAKEFWLCDDCGNMCFFDPRGELERSGMFQKFPRHIVVDFDR